MTERTLAPLDQVSARREGADPFAAIVDPDLMEAEILRLDRLDEAIARTIKRLVQVKAAKQVFPNMKKNARPEPKLITASDSANAQPARISTNQPKRSTQIELIVSAKSDVEKGAFIDQNNVVIEGTRIDKPALVLPRADSQPAVIVEAEPEPTTHTELVVSAKSDTEKDGFIKPNNIVIEGARIEPNLVAPEITKKEHLVPMRVIVEFLRNQLRRICKNCRAFRRFATAWARNRIHPAGLNSLNPDQHTLIDTNVAPSPSPSATCTRRNVPNCCTCKPFRYASLSSDLDIIGRQWAASKPRSPSVLTIGEPRRLASAAVDGAYIPQLENYRAQNLTSVSRL